MRHLAAILGVLAMLVALSGPPAAVAATPCAGMSMAATPDGQTPCPTADEACVSPCLAAGKCQNQCGSSAPFLSTTCGNDWSLRKAGVVMVEELPPPEAASPVDSPPPRI